MRLPGGKAVISEISPDSPRPHLCFSYRCLVELVRVCHIVKAMEFTCVENGRSDTVVNNLLGQVRDDDHRPILPFFEQFMLALFVETAIADSQHLVDEIAVKFNRHGNGKRQARAHAGGVGLNRFAHVAAEF